MGNGFGETVTVSIQQQQYQKVTTSPPPLRTQDSLLASYASSDHPELRVRATKIRNHEPAPTLTTLMLRNMLMLRNSVEVDAR
jgi:hypothetical protein